MRILHIGPVKPLGSAGGPSVSIRSLAAAQAELGLHVGLLSSFPAPVGTSIEHTPGVHLLEGLHEPHYNPWLVSQSWIRRIQTEFGTPDLVNFHSTYVPFQIALAAKCRKLGWPYILTPRAGMTYLAQKVRWYKKSAGNLLFFRSCVRHAEAIHALCEREAEDIQSLFQVKRIITASNGVDDYLFEASTKLAPADLGGFAEDSDLILGFVGRIDMYHKGLDLLFKALALCKSDFPQFKYKLFIVGPIHTKQNEKSVHSLLESLDLRKEVRLLGPKYGQEKLRYFLACDIFVHTSRFEGMPMAVLEAMALKRACLVTPETNMADVVHECGGWVASTNPKSIAQAIMDIWRARTALGAVGKRLQDLARQRFKWSSVAQQLNEEYTEILRTG